MANLQVKSDLEAVAITAAELTAEVLNKAVSSRGQASWLLAGGTAPMGGYRLLASKYADKVDWTKVIVAIGDERCVPLTSPDANWPLIDQTLLEAVGLPAKHQLRPKSDQSPEMAAEDYAQQLSALIADGDGVPHFDMVWLGMGEDGHTLSLFPGHPALNDTEPLVIAVHDSPKPPPDRISLTLRALSKSSNCLIMATGNGKSEIIAKVFGGDSSLPINQAVSAIEAGGGQVTWLVDESAASLIVS
ncbi:MAG TPA: 6-phosphogluconolactonase [Candidatus Dormibacteraeota bacterium]|nr:6-phosphogluconolactonase [Candidatus Dormibacteraeota bacterium]